MSQDIILKIKAILTNHNYDYENFITSINQSNGIIYMIVNQKNFLATNIKKDQFENLLKQDLKQEIKFIYTDDKNNPINEEKTKLKPVGVKKIVLISSCKGGVGKSFVSILLAKALAKNFKVGLLDADIYGPSIPAITNTAKSKIAIENNLFIPIESDGIKLMSMGYFLDEDKAAIWRGPMITKTLYQLLLGTYWQDLDILIIDSPPGTGDISLSLLEKYQINGAILVSTPHLLSINELQKSIYMFNRMNIPIIGCIENMCYFEDQNGKKEYIFGKSDLLNITKDNNIENFFQIPIGKSDHLSDISNYRKYFANEINKIFKKVL